MKKPIDLRDFRWMEFDIVALKNSRFFSSCTGDEFKAAFALWMAAFHQVPAGTLPNDERWLCSQAGYGQDANAWAKVRQMALYGFKLGPDGLLHHTVVEAKALRADERKQHGARGAAKRWSNKRKTNHNQDNARALPEQCSTNARTGQDRTVKKEPPIGVKKEAPLRVARGERLSDGWTPSDELLGWAAAKFRTTHQAVLTETESFSDYWRAQPGQRGVKLDWPATWRNWIRRAKFTVVSIKPVAPLRGG